jgi:putative transposase
LIELSLNIPIKTQCNLLGISTSGYYYEEAPEDPFNLHLMNIIDKQYTKTPFYGVEKMTAHLIRSGYPVNVKRIRRLYHIMNIEAIYPKRLSIPSLDYKYPYLLKNLIIDRPNYVWCADITYIKLLNGFVYLFAIMDWYSRYVLAWKLSNTLDVSFCIDGLERALIYSTPEIFNTDQGSQFTGKEFTSKLLNSGIKISMDSKGRAYDNIFIERLWRSVKYEEVYIKAYISVKDAYNNLSDYFLLYNNERPHQSLDYKTPYEVHFGK